MVSESKSGVCRFCGSPYHRGWQCYKNPKIKARLEEKSYITSPRKSAKTDSKPKSYIASRPKRKSYIRKSPKSDRRKLIHRFDDVFSQYIRRKAELEGNLYCFVCGRKLTYETAVAMHFIGRRAVSVRFNEDNCKVGCRECNAINKEQPEVLRKYAELLGEETVKRLNELKSRKISTPELKSEYEKYCSLLRAL